MNFSKENNKQYEIIFQSVFPNLQMFARDVNLPEALARKYTPGMLLREKAFIDASERFMGMVTTHRYVILSNHMKNLAPLEQGTNWGLHTAIPNSHFKVLAIHTHKGKTGIFLLHLPDDDGWKFWKNGVFDLEASLTEKAIARFCEKCQSPAVPELTTPAWLNRCTFPIGMDDTGNFWPLEEDSNDLLLRSRVRGCLLGGAVGDALGYPVEFLSEQNIVNRYGVQGIETLTQAGSPALISDDTQMALYAANALVYARETNCGFEDALRLAYDEWLRTQDEPQTLSGAKLSLSRDKRLHRRRAPGNTCLQSLRLIRGNKNFPHNNSKGCGSVMRAAPFGLVPLAGKNEEAYRLAALDATLTHGHHLARESSGALAWLLHQIVFTDPARTKPLDNAILSFPQDLSPTLFTLLRKAVILAHEAAISDLDGVHILGKGWVAEEALAIAVFCAVRHQDNFAAALRASVNHNGDSDSTGMICGNLLGAWLGEDAVRKAFDLTNLELCDVVEQTADALLKKKPGPGVQPAHAPSKLGPMRPLREVGMRYTPLTKKALALCYDAHRGQLDKGGLPYVFHPLHLAEQMDTEEEICTALLHDVIEDSHYTLDDLRYKGFPEPVLEALRLLTRTPGEDYFTYITRLRQHPIARRVKAADLLHNSDLSRLDAVSGHDRERAEKYRRALQILQGEN